MRETSRGEDKKLHVKNNPKTRVLINRIAYLIEDKGVNPENIVALTFTKKAAYEMRERLEKRLGYLEDIQIGTFHSVCINLLKRFGECIGVEKNFKIYDEYSSKGILIDILKSRGMKYDKYELNYFAEVLSYYKSNNISIKDAIEDIKTEDDKLNVIIYASYEKECEKRNILDYDSVITKTILLLKDDFVKEWVKSNIFFVSVDEYQDINFAQQELLKCFMHDEINLFAVGDIRQSIYGFRCSSPKFLENFEREYSSFSDTKVIYLDKNYRSTKNIVNASNSLIKNSKSKYNLECKTDNVLGEPIFVHECKDGKDEALFIANQIENLRSKGYKYSDIAILYRVNSQSALIEETFINYGIPYYVEKGMSFFKRAEIKDILSFLKFTLNIEDEESFKRSMRCIDGIGQKTIDNVIHYCKINQFNYYTGLIAYIDSKSETGKNTSLVNKLEKALEIYNKITYYEFGSVGDLIRYIVIVTEYTASLTKNMERKSLQDRDAINSKIRNVNELSEMANYMTINSNVDSVEDFLRKTEIVEDDENLKDQVKLITIHSAKGLEYEAVFVCGVEEDLIPYYLNNGTENEIDEERRLFYVAITRAKKELYLTYCKYRISFDKPKKVYKSMFLDEIGEEFIKFI